MSKVFEIAIVAVVAILGFLGLVTWIWQSAASTMQKDCERIGHTRFGDVVVTCSVKGGA